MTSPTERRLIVDTLEFDGGRKVTVSLPSLVEAVVYCADGGWHTERLSQALDASDRPEAQTTMIVGVHGPAEENLRLPEYVAGVDPDRFGAHERFFVEEVGRYVQDRVGVEVPPERTAVWGASLGAELALALGMRHPDVYGTVLAASPGAGYKPPTDHPGPWPRTYLTAGTEEPFFLKNARRWAASLKGVGADVVIQEREGSHGGQFWFDEFPLMVAWAYDRTGGR